MFKSLYVSDVESGSRDELLKLLAETAVARAWSDLDIDAKDDRVFWEEAADGVFVYYKESVE